MADTLQIVRWALERSCPYRHGENWQDPQVTSEQLRDFTTLTRAIADGRVVDDVCVTSWSEAWPFKTDKGKTDYEKSVPIASSGFRVAERFAKYGGVEPVFAACAGCEANAAPNPRGQLAGCHGYVWVYPDSDELEESLQRSLAELGMSWSFFEYFQETDPIWYGLWMESPLRGEQAKVLRPVLERAFAEETDEGTGIEQFVRALDVAERFQMNLHVELAPLGHVDLGWHTVFPHCPRCKANARVGRWQERYTREIHPCHVCGHHFVPDDHHSMEQEGDRSPSDSHLETEFGFAAYGEFVRRYAESQYCTQEEAAAGWQEELNRREISARYAAEYRARPAPSPEELAQREEELERGRVARAVVRHCPECGMPLRTGLAKQCFECGADWH